MSDLKFSEPLENVLLGAEQSRQKGLCRLKNEQRLAKEKKREVMTFFASWSFLTNKKKCR